MTDDTDRTNGTNRPDERELDELFARARALRPAPGARERVLARAERTLQAPPRAASRKLALGALAFAFVSAAASALWLAPPNETRAPREPALEALEALEQADTRAARRAPKPRATPVDPQAHEPAQAPAPEQAAPAVRSAKVEPPARPRPATPSELALQVDAYRQALALRGRDDARAVELWRAMNQRWPRSPLRHEIDLGVIDALVRLGRREEARGEARSFLERHPRSSKAAAVRSMLGDPGAANDPAKDQKKRDPSAAQ